MSCLNTSPPNCGSQPNCPDKFGCTGQCPDFEIKRHDTMPSFKYSVEDEEGDPIDLTGLVLEASMWAKAKLKTDIDDNDTVIAFADGIGFEQALEDDVIVVDRVRSPEQMLIVSFDEVNKTITVERGYNGTTAAAVKKGTGLKIFRFRNSPATTEMTVEDVEQIDGTVETDVLQESFLVYEWSANDTCVPGCFWLEFKLMQMASVVEIPSVTPVCYSGDGVEWVRRFPACGELLIKICDSPTKES